MRLSGSPRDSSFLDLLLTKAAAVIDLQHQGFNANAALIEVQRQIRQATNGGCIFSGRGVTKSSEEHE